MVTNSEIRNKDIISQVDDVMVKVCYHCDVMWHLSLNGSLVPYLVPLIMRERNILIFSLPPLSHSHTLSLSLTHSLSHTHTFSLSHTLSLSHALFWCRSIGRRTPRNGTRKENIFFGSSGLDPKLQKTEPRFCFLSCLHRKRKTEARQKWILPMTNLLKQNNPWC